MTKLKPCPFCGEGEDGGVHIILNAYLNGIERYAVMCEACGVETYGYETQKEAIKAWNTRHEPRTPNGAYVPAGNERLRK